MNKISRWEKLGPEEWLPDEIMYLIIGKLIVFPINLARFSAVCKRWHRLLCDSWPKLIQQHQITPLVLVPVVDWIEEWVQQVSYRMYNLTGERVPVSVNSLPYEYSARIVGSSFGWLIIVSEDSVSVFNPLSKSCIRMPPLNVGVRYLVKGVLSKAPLLEEEENPHFDIAITMSHHQRSYKPANMIAFLHMEKVGELESMRWVYLTNVPKILDLNSIGGRICILYINGIIGCCKWSTDRLCYYFYAVRKEWSSMFLNSDCHVSAYLLESSSSEPLVVFRSDDYKRRPIVEFKIFTLSSNNEGFNKTWNLTEEAVNAMKMMERTQPQQQHLNVLNWTEIKTIGNDVIFLSDNADSICFRAADGSKLPAATAGSIYFPEEKGLGFSVFNVQQNCISHFANNPDGTNLFRWQPPIWLMTSYAVILKFSSIG